MGTYEVIEHQAVLTGSIGWTVFELKFNDPRGNYSLNDIVWSELPAAIEAAEKMGYTKS